MSLDYWRRWPAPLTFTNPGDEAIGVVIGTGDPRDQWPELHLKQDDGIVRIVRITQARLRELLGELVPCEGDWLRIVYTGDAKKAAPGKSPTKEFTVEIRRAKDPGSRGGTGSGGVRGSAPPPENTLGARK